MHEICLQWVLVQGEICHVSDFAGLETYQRPDAYCPVCKKPVILKLGDIRTHHAAHQDGVICIATQPETAIHINAKYYLKQILANVNKLTIWQFCNGWEADSLNQSCLKDNKRNITYIQDWDRVEDEWQFGKFRLDLALLKRDKVIGAIEILVTHPTEENKKEYLKQQNVSWVEIKVDPNFYSSPTAWTDKIPLTPETYNESDIQAWQCSDCSSYLEKYIQRREEEKREANERLKKRDYANQFEIVAIRLIDFYYPSGKKYRKLYVIQKMKKQEKVMYADLQEKTDKWCQIEIERPPITDKSFESLKIALEKELEKQERPGWFIDKSRNWQSMVGGYDLKYYFYPDFHPFNYERVDEKWQKIINKSTSDQQRPPWKAFGIEIPSKPSKMDDAISSIFKEYTCIKCGKITSDWISGDGVSKTCVCRECNNRNK